MTVSSELINWKSSGDYISFGPHNHQLFVKQLGEQNASVEKTLLLLHGFPESSFSYHVVLDALMKVFDRIILFDMLGYGWSDKPLDDYSYSLMEQADSAFVVWRHFGIEGGHLLAHDMGNSVATEIVARHENGLMPHWFSEGLQSLTLTNGSIVLSLAKLRFTQKLLLTRYGHLMGYVVNYKLFRHQVRSAHGNDNLSDAEIRLLWESNTIQDGVKRSHHTIKYIKDRRQFEKTRWLPALAQTKLPVHICWGDEDAVARVEMAYYLKENICKEATLTIMKGLGHFGQLGSPERWAVHVCGFYLHLHSKNNTA